MLTPFIVNLNGLDPEKKEYVLDRMNMIGYTGVRIKASENRACMFCDKSSTLDTLAEFLSVDPSHITDATGWDMEAWAKR